MKRCILNVAVGGWYPRGQARLRDSLKQHGFQSDFLCWCDQWPPGSPPHQDVPYAFKSYAFQEAVRRGYESIFWLDASCWAIRPVEPMFDEMEAQGHLFSAEGSVVGNWIKDEALAIFGLSRDDAMKIPMIGGMFMGVCLTHERSQKWLNRFVHVCQNTNALPGSLHNILTAARTTA